MICSRASNWTDPPSTLLWITPEPVTQCVVRLDRFGRSLKELLETVELFKARQTRLRKELRKANSL
jgi:hypothetical protein